MNQPHSRSTRYFVLLGLAVLAISAAGAFWAHSAVNKDDGNPVPVAPSNKGLVCYGFVDVDGGIVPLYPLQPGRVTAVCVKENEDITDPRQKPLLKMDATLAEQRLKEAEADLRAAEDQLKQAEDAPKLHDLKVEQQKEAIKALQAEVNAAKSGLERAEDLVKVKGLSEPEANVMRQRMTKSEAGLRAEQAKLKELEELDRPQLLIDRAKQDVAAKEARVAQAKYALDECQLWAPGPGTVLQVLVNPGTVLGGQPAQPAVVFLPKTDNLIIRAEVEQEFASRVAKDKEVDVQEENSTKQTWKGKITQIARWYAPRRVSQVDALKINSDVHTLECIITLKDMKPDQGELRVGQRVRVMIGKD